MTLYCVKCGHQDLAPKITEFDLIQAHHDGWMEGYSKCAKTSTIFFAILAAIAFVTSYLWVFK